MIECLILCFEISNYNLDKNCPKEIYTQIIIWKHSNDTSHSINSLCYNMRRDQGASSSGSPLFKREITLTIIYIPRHGGWTCPKETKQKQEERKILQYSTNRWKVSKNSVVVFTAMRSLVSATQRCIKGQERHHKERGSGSTLNRRQ